MNINSFDHKHCFNPSSQFEGANRLFSNMDTIIFPGQHITGVPKCLHTQVFNNTYYDGNFFAQPVLGM
jgi:hypothetical protein